LLALTTTGTSEVTVRQLRQAIQQTLAGLLMLVAAAGAAAQLAAPVSEASVKAAYLYKFTAFVEWPPSAFAGPTSPVIIGVSGADAVYAELAQVLAGRTVEGRPLHVLYMGRPMTTERMGWLQALQGRPVLIVTDGPSALGFGSALNFLTVDGRVRFEASLAGAERSGLRLSARLLAVAERVVSVP
jgi:hypothetical protein